MLNIGDRLREERERLGLNQADFGALSDVAKTSQFNYESGKRMPDAAYLAAIAANGADVLYILTGQRMGAVSNAPTPALKPDEAALLDNYRHSPPEAQAAIKATSALLAQPKCNKKAG